MTVLDSQEYLVSPQSTDDEYFVPNYGENTRQHIHEGNQRGAGNKRKSPSIDQVTMALPLIWNTMNIILS